MSRELAADWLGTAVDVEGGALAQLSYMIDEVGIWCADTLPADQRGKVVNALTDAHFDINRLQVRLAEVRRELVPPPIEAAGAGQLALSDRAVAARSGAVQQGSGHRPPGPATAPSPAQPNTLPRR
ncbi:hypothetical protein [Kitasatospora sp. GAS1066B]|uniref:hypothetical protein n=1 Tax=Kitasatospora sp. GAS1066B TaxID=3156271 RepID=UPI00351500AE